MGISLLLDDPFYGTLPLSALVPGVFPVALNGRPYFIDTKYAGSDGWGRRSIPLLRDQADTSDRPGEQSLSRDGTWRRSTESWHRGAGQEWNDRDESDAYRFRSSKGINVWEKWGLTLLSDTAQRRSSSNTNLELVTAADANGAAYLYASDGEEVYYSADGSTFSASLIFDGEAAQSVKSLASTGDYVYAALGTAGIHRTAVGAATSAHYSDLSATLIAYVKGRLMAANGGAIYNVTASGAAPAALYTHPLAAWRWVGFAEGQGHIYAAGYSGDKSLVYRTAVKADGTALDVPIVAGELPDGEVIRGIRSYLGFILLGTNNGVRFAQADSNGNLEIGALIETDSAVYAFEGQDRFVWFGWTDYDAASTGLGRLDLTQFNGSAPAYASDLMATGQGSVTSIATFGDKRYFAVSGLGIYGETTTPVASGSLDSGVITYDLPDPKVAMFVDVRHDPLSGSISPSLAVDGGLFSTLATHSDVGSTGFSTSAGERSGERFELRLTLTPSGSDAPVVTRLSLRSRPATARGRYFFAPLLLHETVEVKGGDQAVNPLRELEAIEGLTETAIPVLYQEGARTFSVIVEDYEWKPSHLTRNGDFWNGTCVVKLALSVE